MAFKWTAPRTWVAGEMPPAATLNSHIRDNLEALNGFVLKAADESVTSSAALQDDNHLLFTIPQAGTYIVDAWLWATSAANAAGDLAVGFSFPSGTMHIHGQGTDATLASGTAGPGQWLTALSATSGVSNVPFGLSTGNVGIHIVGILIASASGTLQLRWAQTVSNVNASTVKAGSFMTVRQVA